MMIETGITSEEWNIGDVKYGGLDKAEGSPELEELRKLIGAK